MATRLFRSLLAHHLQAFLETRRAGNGDRDPRGQVQEIKVCAFVPIHDEADESVSGEPEKSRVLDRANCVCVPEHDGQKARIPELCDSLP